MIKSFVQIDCAGKSPATERWYLANLRGLAGALGERELGDLDGIELQEWAAGILRSGQARYTAAGRIRAARRFFRWCYQNGQLQDDLSRKLRLPRLPKGMRSGIADGDYEAIMAQARRNPRDLALLLFLASSGARCQGAARLVVADLALDADDERMRRRATVTEKGEKTRIVIISPETEQALRVWISQRPARYGASVFGLSTAGIREVLRRYRRQLGLSGKVSPHQFRHRFARKLLAAGMEIGMVGDLMGHESVLTTKDHYGILVLDTIQDVLERHSQELNARTNSSRV